MRSRYSRQELVRFQHCDPAGVVFYPRYVEMVNAAVEDWFGAVIGINFAEIHTALETAIPARALQLDFQLPSRIGEILDISVEVAKVGGTSITLNVAAECDGKTRFQAIITLVHVPKSDFRPTPWPARFRNAFDAARPAT